MKSNAVYEIEKRLKDAFNPMYMVVEESSLVEKKFKILIAANHFQNQEYHHQLPISPYPYC